VESVSGGTVFQGRDFYFYRDGPPGERPDHGSWDPWARRVADSPVWDHVRQGRDTESFRAAGLDVVERLLPLRDEAEQALRADPWLDPGVAVRFLDRVEVLLGEPGRSRDLDLYPAEAALLVLVPFLFRVHGLRAAARFVGIGPTSLDREPDAGPERLSFEGFAEENAVLVKRARRGPDDEAAIGWWLFHRWMLRPANVPGREPLRALVDQVQAPGSPLGRTLEPERLSRFFHGLRRGPGVCNPEFLDLLEPDERVRAQGGQRVREQRLMLVLALAFGMAMEASSLPSVVADHLAVPDPVDPGRLRRDLEEAHWGGPEDLPVLAARCHHAAVIEGLQEYVARLDELLHELHRTVRSRINQPVPDLPVRLSTDGVRPAEGVFEGWARFRIDERRARELLTGVQLYKDRDLAIRELYQNALDACRYRRARTEYLDRTSSATHTFDGSIAFAQGVDGEGRRYVDCRDNGVGMGEAELRGVFSQAGSRFAEEPDFLAERQTWESLDPPVELFPNSRFGIGVLGYFMLADEIRVTTCRMRSDGTPGPVIEAAIRGPGNLFRIRLVSERGEEPGTCVRLYLTGEPAEDPEWSCADALGSVLGISEFRTTARDKEKTRIWEPGELRPEGLPKSGRSGMLVWGAGVEWEDAPEGVRVFWCEHGGALMVDGLLVRPTVRRGVLGREGSGLTGAVVNLSGRHSPGSMSADRTEVLSDVSAQVGVLLERAVDALRSAGPEFWSFTWLTEVCRGSASLGDIVTAFAIDEGRRHVAGDAVDSSDGFTGRAADWGESGFLPIDAELIGGGGFPAYFVSDGLPSVNAGRLLDHVSLWRVLAVGNSDVAEELRGLCPELADTGPLRRALPSDQVLLFGTADSRVRGFDDGPGSPEMWESARYSGMTVEEVVRRWGELGVLGPDPCLWRDFLAEAGHSRALCSLATKEWFDIAGDLEPVPLAYVSHVAGMDIEDMARLLRRFGAGVSDDAVRLAGSSEAEAARRLWSAHERRSARWRTWSPGLLEAAGMFGASELSDFEVLERLVGLGVDTSAAATDLLHKCVDGGPELAAEFRERGTHVLLTEGLSYGQVLRMVRWSDLSLERVVSALRGLGLDIPLRVPASPSPLAEHLLSDRYQEWRQMRVGSTVPFAYALDRERRTGTAAHSIVAALAEYGIPTSCEELPEGLDLPTAFRLLYGESTRMTALEPTTVITLHHLLTGARWVDAPLTQVATWFRQLGFDVPEVAGMIRRAIPLLPRRDGDRREPGTKA
jgi:hypothetical protein